MSREEALVRALVELADTLVADYDTTEYLYRLAERCVEVVDAAAAGVLLMDGEKLTVAAATSHELRALEVFEAAEQQGPGMEAYHTEASVNERDLADSQTRWPDFTSRAVELDYRCVHAHPLRLRTDCIGALSVFWAQPAGSDASDELICQGLADMATIGITHERALTAAQDQIHHLRQALEGRAVIEQAKALLAERLHTDTGDAFDWLRRYARNHNQRLRDVAQRFLDGKITQRDVAEE